MYHLKLLEIYICCKHCSFKGYNLCKSTNGVRDVGVYNPAFWTALDQVNPPHMF